MKDMHLIESQIIEDLIEIKDPMSQLDYIIECGRFVKTCSKTLEIDGHKVKECQSNTCLNVQDDKGIYRFCGNSDSLILRGFIALLQEIYDGQRLDDVNNYKCGLVHHKICQKFLSNEQIQFFNKITSLNL